MCWFTVGAFNEFIFSHLFHGYGCIPMILTVQVFLYKGLVINLRGGGGATKWENRGSETFCAPPSRQGKTFCPPPFYRVAFFCAPPPITMAKTSSSRI